MNGRFRVAGCALAVGLSSAACGSPDKEAPGGIKVGAVLPFSGPLAATGSNVERVLLLLTERVNAAGGVGGQDVEVVSADSHSDNTRGLIAAQSLVNQSVLGVLGPESEDLAKLMHPLLDARDTLLISPGISSPSISSLTDRGLWFRVGPSTSLFGKSLAERIYGDGVRDLAIMYMNDEYGAGFASILRQDFLGLGGRVASAQPLELGSVSYARETRAALLSGSTACALLAYPKPGAIVVNDATSLEQSSSWYFAPPLRSPAFVSNIAGGSVSGQGVSSALDPSSNEFVAAFRQRWFGDVPMHEAFAYYDGLAVLLLAYQAALAAGVSDPSALDVREYMAEVSRPPGSVIKWDELELGLDLVARGEPVDYRGVSGSVDLSDHGDTPNASVQPWSMNNGIITDR